VVRFARLIYRRGRVLGRTCGPRRLRRRSQPALVAAQDGTAAVTAVSAPAHQQVEQKQPDSQQGKEDQRVVLCNVRPALEHPNPWTLNLQAHPMAREYKSARRPEHVVRARLYQQS
jgi:hypothetical protein